MNSLKKIFLLVTLSVATFSFSQSTDAGTATIDGNYCLVLDNDSEIQEQYSADATGLNWTSAAHAVKKCGFHTNNLVTYKADYENNRILIQIHTDRTYDSKDVIWWNQYLQSICK
ncbi:MAG: hypothetical protein GQ574_21965 [Crocinitomix sp.]|nr:hypothetical protein [Crocinitomix sp.]